MPDNLLTVPEVAARLHATPPTIRRWLRVTDVDEISEGLAIRTVVTVTVPKRGP